MYTNGINYIGKNTSSHTIAFDEDMSVGISYHSTIHVILKDG